MDSTKLIKDQIRITGSDTGGMKMTQECIDFMAEHSLFPETQIISSLDQLATAENALKLGDSSTSEYRYVLDIRKMLNDTGL